MNMTIQKKIALLAGLCLAAIVAVLLLSFLYAYNRTSSEVQVKAGEAIQAVAEQRLTLQAQAESQRLERFFSSTYEVTDSVTRIIMGARQVGLASGSDALLVREQITAQLGELLRSKPSLLGVWTVFESNAFYGDDRLFVDMPNAGSNEIGRFAQYWTQPTPGDASVAELDEKSISNSALGTTGQPKNLWYTCPITTKRVCVLDPYTDMVQGKETLMSSIAIPLLENGKVIGVAGVDVSLDRLQGMVLAGKQALYDGAGDISIVSAGGFLAGFSRDAQQLAKSIDTVIREPGVRASIKAATPSLETQDGILRVVQPITTSEQTAPWVVLIELPQAVLLAPVEAIHNYMSERLASVTLKSMLIGLVATALGLALMWTTAKGITRPIQSVSRMLQNIASGDGDLTQRLTYNKQDELGELAGWFNRFLAACRT
ncbi:HAMP domain-containing protein [Pseudomonas aeruginosa]|uniref:methyl-accepting chemotaxis protein n=1 Tax=Pseudomonas aeruginosa TaxID=287 RepID=UPI0003B9DC0C|nr:HAMP domain-containing protein [Pseudomonas aeruginosa]ERU51810.1 hypothetical protein Q091_00060 [Pseudomonas aeruginosa C52]PBY55319.1 hypothetical protein CJT54_30690 [Pseudomonas aeruginosa]PCB50774.1 hypothetical protein CJT85_31960 [Pseudomonas aeruginosa]PCC07675.1 hypothetical protein CJT53_28950 [Pseudomonas aeruginosa]